MDLKWAEAFASEQAKSGSWLISYLFFLFLSFFFHRPANLYLRFLHQTEQNYWATSLAFLSHGILHLRFYGENQAHAQAFLGHLLDTSGGGIPLRVARRATIITSLLFLFLPPVHCCSTVYSPPERAEGARDGRILSPCSSLLLHRLSSCSVSRRSQSTVRALPLLLLLISIGVEPDGQ